MPAEEDKKEVHENLWTQLKKAVKDVLTLDVVTATGTLKLGTGQGGVMDLEQMIEKAKAVTGSNLEAVAVSHLAFDRDLVSFVKAGLDEEQKALLEFHREMVKEAQEMRDKAVQTIASAIGLLK